jgi:hypothetical protein
MILKKTIFTIPVNIFLLFFFLAPIHKISAQLKVSSALIKQDTIETPGSIIDSLSLRSGTVSFESERQAKSGNLAMLLSALLPGAGQIYAHRYYTVPIIWGFGAYFSLIAIKQNKQYQDYRGKYAESVRLDTAKHSGNADFLRSREFYHNQRDQFIFYLALTYILNIVDAYVGAVLYNFDVSDNLGGNAEIQFRIPLH